MRVPTDAPGDGLRRGLEARRITPFIGVYDAFSASLAARHFDALFLSGFGFSASHYGLPDIGFNTWADMLDWVRRVRTILPEHHLLVDIDDGFADVEIAGHSAAMLERAGASGIVMEDQRRPKRCGHVPGRRVLDLDLYLEKLRQVLRSRDRLFVVARTDADVPAEILRRVAAFSDAGADAVLVDGLSDLGLLREVAAAARCRLMFNQIAGGRSPAATLTELADLGVSLVNYSTPCLFAAQAAIDRTLDTLRAHDGDLRRLTDQAALTDCTRILDENLSGSVRGPGSQRTPDGARVGSGEGHRRRFP